MPEFFRRKTSPDWVPGGIFKINFSSKVSTSTLPPSVATEKGILSSLKTSWPLRENFLSLAICTTIYKSPGVTPRPPASPWPSKTSVCPSSMPAGIGILIRLSSFTRPSPPHCEHFFLIICPVPPHCGHSLTCEKTPKKLRVVFFICPVPLHCGQVSCPDPGSPPDPPQRRQIIPLYS